MGNAWSFGAGMAVGFRLGEAWAVASGVVKDAIDSVCNAAEAVMDYLRTAASWAWEKLKAAAAFVMEKVLKLLRRQRGRKEAAAARSEMDSAAAADASQQASFRPGSHPGSNVLSRASARVAGGFGRLQVVKAGLPPPSSTMFSATAPGGALALPASVAAPAARAAQLASEMMMALLETDVAALGDTIPEAARSCISVVVAAVGIGLEAIAAAALLDA